MQDSSEHVVSESPAPRAVADGRERQVDPRSIDAQRIALSIFWGIVCVGSLPGVIFAGVFSSWPGVVRAGLGAAWALQAVLAAVHTIRWPVLEYRHLSYRVTESEIRIRRGVWWRSVESVPRSRVQHTDVSEGPIQRGYGLATLVIYTAGTQHAAVSLGGLAHDTAVEIRNHLIDLIDSGEPDGC